VACIVKPNCEDREAPGSGGLTWGEYLPQHISVTVKDAVKMLYQETKSAAPNAAVVALGYPLLVSGIECPDLSVPFLGFSEEEQQFVREMVDLVNEVLEDAAQEVGIHFLDVATEFSDHEICDSDPWIHSIKKIPFVFSIHPTERGQVAYASVLNRFLEQTGVEYAHGFFAGGLPKNPPPQP
jgi:hypothetical protein